MKTTTLAAAALLAFAPAALSAQAAPSAAPAAAAPSDDAAADVLPGATVYDAQGGEVGKIISVDGNSVVVDTGTNRAGLEKSGFAKGPNGPVIGMTKDQLNQAISAAAGESAAKLDAALVAGAAVVSSDGVAVGTIKEIDATGNVVLDRAAGGVALPKSQFTTNASGAVSLRFTNAQLEAALAQQAPAAPAAPAK